MCILNKQIDPIESVILNFAPLVQKRLRNIPIWTSPFVKTAMAQTVKQVPFDKVKIRVNPKFSNYSESFKAELLTHEYLHCLQAEIDIGIEAFHRDVQTWYISRPPTEYNYIAHTLEFQIYNSGRYKLKDYPIEEYAYIGTVLTWGGARLKELPESIKAYYSNILKGL